MSTPSSLRQLARDYAEATGATYTQALEAVRATPTTVVDGLVWQPLRLIDNGLAPNIYGPARRVKKMVGLLESSALAQNLNIDVLECDREYREAKPDAELVICDANDEREVNRRDLMSSLGLSRGVTTPTCVAIAHPAKPSTIEPEMFADLRHITNVLKTHYVQRYDPDFFLQRNTSTFIVGPTESGTTNMCRWLAQRAAETKKRVFVLSSSPDQYNDLDVSIATSNIETFVNGVHHMPSSGDEVVVIVDDIDTSALSYAYASELSAIIEFARKVRLACLIHATHIPLDRKRFMSMSVVHTELCHSVECTPEKPDLPVLLGSADLKFTFAVPYVEKTEPVIETGSSLGRGGVPDAIHIDGGLAIIGRPGCGKSTALRPIMAGEHPGNIVAFTHLAADAMNTKEVLEQTGRPVTVIDVGDPRSAALTMFDPNTISPDAARNFIDALAYADGEASLQARTREVLQVMLESALELTKEIGGNPIDTAISLCQKPEAYLERLAQQAKRGSHVAARSLRALREVLGDDDQDRHIRLEAALNRLRALDTIPSWWDSKRQHLSWSHLLTGRRAIIVHVGESLRDEEYSITEATNVKRMSSLAMFSLNEELKNHDQPVSIFVDDLAATWGGDETPLSISGENVRHFVATGDAARYLKTNHRSDATLWMSQSSAQTVQCALDVLHAAGGFQNESDMDNLATGQGYLVTMRDSLLQSPRLVTISSRDHEANIVDLTY